jgi:hypothetical protein
VGNGSSGAVNKWFQLSECKMLEFYGWLGWLMAQKLSIGCNPCIRQASTSPVPLTRGADLAGVVADGAYVSLGTAAAQRAIHIVAGGALAVLGLHRPDKRKLLQDGVDGAPVGCGRVGDGVGYSLGRVAGGSGKDIVNNAHGLGDCVNDSTDGVEVQDVLDNCRDFDFDLVGRASGRVVVDHGLGGLCAGGLGVIRGGLLGGLGGGGLGGGGLGS